MPMPEIVKVRFKSHFQPGEWSPREYSYYAAVPLKVGDLVVVPSKYRESVAKVSQVHVDEREVRDYLHVMQTISTRPIGHEDDSTRSGHACGAFTQMRL